MKELRTVYEVSDARIIRMLRAIGTPLSRAALFIVFFWFGILKLFGASPASPLVQALFMRTISGISFENFMVLFGTYEMIIDVLFLIPRSERLAIALLLPHMAMTMLPLMLLPQLTWSGFLIPTLEGQYIIKNLVIIALAVGIGAQLHTARHDRSPHATH